MKLNNLNMTELSNKEAKNTEGGNPITALWRYIGAAMGAYGRNKENQLTDFGMTYYDTKW